MLTKFYFFRFGYVITLDFKLRLLHLLSLFLIGLGGVHAFVNVATF
jgi:hypothetical protein